MDFQNEIPSEGKLHLDESKISSSYASNQYINNSFRSSPVYKKLSLPTFTQYRKSAERLNSNLFNHITSFKTKQISKEKYSNKNSLVNPYLIPKPTAIDRIIQATSNGNLEQLRNMQESKKINEASKLYDELFSPEMLLSFRDIVKLRKYEDEIMNQPIINLPLKPFVKSDKTLIIDLEDFLISSVRNTDSFPIITIDHSSIRTCFFENQNISLKTEYKFIIRPFAMKFLQELSSIYEIIVI